MTNTKKSTPKSAAKKEGSEVTRSKEECLEVIDSLTANAKTLRDAVVNDKEPDITVLSFLCNENTGEVHVNAYGNGKSFTTLLASACRRDEDLQRALLMAAVIV